MDSITGVITQSSKAENEKAQGSMGAKITRQMY